MNSMRNGSILNVLDGFSSKSDGNTRFFEKKCMMRRFSREITKFRPNSGILKNLKIDDSVKEIYVIFRVFGDL